MRHNFLDIFSKQFCTLSYRFHVTYKLNMICVLWLSILSFIYSADCTNEGTKFIGLGYNLLMGNPDGGDLSHIGVDTGIRTTRHIIKLTPEIEQKLIVSDNKTTCIPRNATALFYGPKSYQDYLMGDIVTSGIGDSSISPYAFTKSTVFQDIDHRTVVNHDVMRDTITVCNKGKTRYIMPPLYTDIHAVTDEFASAVCHLPINYDKDAYRQFLDTWGTHVITGVEIGTKVVTRYQQSVPQIGDILLTYNIGVGNVTVVNDYMGYSTVIHLYVNNLHHDDYYRIPAGTLDGTLKIGTESSPQPIAYNMATIATFIDETMWGILNDNICDSFNYDLSTWRNNTVRALEEYPKLSGHLSSPTDPDLKIPVTWPHGTYGLYKPLVGCPKSPLGWAEGWRRQDAEDSDNSNTWTPGIHLAGSMQHNKPTFYFCMKTTNENSQFERDWPSGNYCLLKKGGCPTGFNSGSIFWDDEDIRTDNGVGGTVPDGSYGDNTRIEFCCRSDGDYKNEILLPIDHSFYLLRYSSPSCQKVFGMNVTEETFKMDTEDNFNKDSCSGAHPYDPNCNENHELHFCYYENENKHGGFSKIIFG